MSVVRPTTRSARRPQFAARVPRFAAFVLSISLAACSGPATPVPAGTAAAPSASVAATSVLSPSVPSRVPDSTPLASPSGSITLYTSVTQATIDAVVAGWTGAHPGVSVEVFRAPTAEVAARIATDLQSGGLRADVLWLSDPLSIAAYADQNLLQGWSPPSAAAIDSAYRTDTFFGTRLLNMVMIRGTGAAPAVADWKDLLAADVKGAIGIPDPGFAGSAFAALAYFDQAAGYGTAFYQSLKDNGATQVKSPDDVTTGVAEGRFKVGMTLDNSARTAIKKGSPVELVWPTSGAIAIYSPIAAVTASDNQATADSFVDFTLSAAGQTAIAGTGWQPVVGDGGPRPEGSQVSPDWQAAFGKQKDLLAAYRAIFGG